MIARMMKPAVLAIVGSVLCGTLGAQGFEYATGTSRYRVTTMVKITQDVMGQTQDASISSGERFSLVLVKQAKDTLAMTVTLDSIGSDSPMAQAPDYSKLVGAKILAWVSPAGQLYSSQPPTGDQADMIANVADEITRTLPHIRGSLATGSTWTDTLSGKVSQMGMAVDRFVVSVYTVAGDTTIGGEKTWKLARTSTSQTFGSGAMQGQAMTMQGTSAGSGMVYVTAKGRFLGGQSTEDAKAKITLSANGLEVNVTTQARTTVANLD